MARPRVFWFTQKFTFVTLWTCIELLLYERVVFGWKGNKYCFMNWAHWVRERNVDHHFGASRFTLLSCRDIFYWVEKLLFFDNLPVFLLLWWMYLLIFSHIEDSVLFVSVGGIIKRFNLKFKIENAFVLS